jgi:hypothetical protein
MRAVVLNIAASSLRRRPSRPSGSYLDSKSDGAAKDLGIEVDARAGLICDSQWEPTEIVANFCFWDQSAMCGGLLRIRSTASISAVLPTPCPACCNRSGPLRVTVDRSLVVNTRQKYPRDLPCIDPARHGKKLPTSLVGEFVPSSAGSNLRGRSPVAPQMSLGPLASNR